MLKSIYYSILSGYQTEPYHFGEGRKHRCSQLRIPLFAIGIALCRYSSLCGSSCGSLLTIHNALCTVPAVSLRRI